MFRNYLTYNFGLNFHRSCVIVDLPAIARERLLRSSESVVHHLARAIQTSDPKEELRQLCVALLCLRDCRETLLEYAIRSRDLEARQEVLQDRLERLCLKASAAEGGQLALFG